MGGRLLEGDVSIAAGVVEAVGLPVGRNPLGVAVPGFVDLQVNGFGGVQFIEAHADEMTATAEALGRAGVVHASPTLCSASVDRYRGALGHLATAIAAEPNCGLLPAHLEGPFLSTRFAGSHDTSTFREPDAGVLVDLCGAGPVGMITLAPESDGASGLIVEACSRGLLVSLGHTAADADTCRAAADIGARSITHCWNAHRRFGHRDPGPAGWAMDDPRCTVGLIADGVHVAPEVLALTFSAARGRVAVTTDAIAPAGTDVDRWRDVRVDGGAARLGDGTLAGSVATPSDMLRVLGDAGVAFEDAVDAMHRPQAEALGLAPWSLRPGDPANVVVLADDFEVRSAWRSGEPLGC